MTGTATITAALGPGTTVENKVINDIKAFFVDLESQVLSLKIQNKDQTGPGLEFDLNGVDTFTVTIAGSVYTLTVSTP